MTCYVEVVNENDFPWPSRMAKSKSKVLSRIILYKERCAVVVFVVPRRAIFAVTRVTLLYLFSNADFDVRGGVALICSGLPTECTAPAASVIVCSSPLRAATVASICSPPELSLGYKRGIPISFNESHERYGLRISFV